MHPLFPAAARIGETIRWRGCGRVLARGRLHNNLYRSHPACGGAGIEVPRRPGPTEHA